MSRPGRAAALALALLATAATALAAPAAPFDAPATGTSAVPAMMQAVRQHAFGGPEALKLETVPVPRPGAGQVLVEVRAASVNPIDWKVREGQLKSYLPTQLPAVPGRDAAGVVRVVGAGVSGWKPGDEVVAYPADAQGAYAEYLVVPATELARKPAALTFPQAAAYPLVALTAWNAVEAARPAPGETVLVHGGAGGVGAFVVQFAKLRGARVIATASARNLEFVRALGADQVVDYRTVRFEDVARDVDAVIDTVGGETLARSPAVVKRGGRLVTIAGRLPEDACRARELACAWSNADNAPGRLEEITNLIALGKVRVFVDRTFPLAEAAAAQEANRAGGGRGKVVIVVKDDARR